MGSSRLSLFTIILININIMIGTGIFINTTELAKRAGIFGSLSYALVALLLLPLVISIADLLRIYPGEGFFHFGARSIHPFVGFLSTWSYFFAKLGSATLGIHVSMSILQNIITPLTIIPTVALDALVIILLTYLNTKNMKLAATLQRLLVAAKSIPILLAISFGIFLLKNGVFYASTHVTTSSFIESIPLVLFSLLGFESVCSLSSRIQDPKANGYKAVLISYALVVAIYVIYQTLFYTSLGELFLSLADYRAAFPALIGRVVYHEQLQAYLSILTYIFIGSSALSSAYSILFSNQWNLHTLASEKQFIGHHIIARLNESQVPYVCAIIEAIFCLTYLMLTHGQQFVLQQLAAFGSTITYLLSTISLFAIASKMRMQLMALCGIGSCILLLLSCIHNFMRNGQLTLVIFCSMLIFGIILHILESTQFKRRKRA